MKLLIVTSGLNSGGAEKSAIKLCESFISDGNQVILVTISNQFDFYVLNESITRINLEHYANKKKYPFRIGLNTFSYWAHRFKSGLKFRKLILREKPDCIISFSAYVAVFTFLSTRFLGAPQIGSERINPDSRVFSHGVIIDKFRPLIYRFGVILSVQTTGVQNWCKDHWKISGFLTPNHIANFPTKSQMENCLPIPLRKNEILAISRDHFQKNLEFLMQAWMFVEKLNPSAHLTLVGAASTVRLENLKTALGLRNLSIYERTEQITSFFMEAKIFVSTSRFEGFPNVILEAISFGIPVVTTPSCDLVIDFADAGAVLVEYSQNPENFANTIVRLLEDGPKLSELSRNALDLSKEYSWDKVGKTWYTAIASAKKENNLM